MPKVVNFSNAVSLAMHTMVVLSSRPDKKFSTRQLSELFYCSEAHLSKVLQRLAKERLVKSERGPKGGFTLEKTAEKLTLLNVYEAIEGPIEKNECLLDAPVCGEGGCILGKLVVSVNDYVRNYLKNTRLSEINSSFWKDLTFQRLSV